MDPNDPNGRRLSIFWQYLFIYLFKNNILNYIEMEILHLLSHIKKQKISSLIYLIQIHIPNKV